MGTMIQQYRLHEEDFRGDRFAAHPVSLQGCNDVLSLTNPTVVRDIHRRYLEAGADIIETNTFNAQPISMAGYGLADHCRDINLAAARLARECADEFSSSAKPRFVAGSVGPTSRTVFSEDSTFPSSLMEAYREQMEALLEGGVDALLIETIFDVENARIAIEAAEAAMTACQRRVPLMLSFTVATPDGHNMLGQSIISFLSEKLPSSIYSVGINCFADVAAMTPLVKELARFGTRVSIYPNMGTPDSDGRYTKAPEELLRDVLPLLEGHHLNIIGGCCGTTDAFIRLLSSHKSYKNPISPTSPTPRNLSPSPSPKERGVYSPSVESFKVKTNHSPLLGRGAGGEVSGVFPAILSGDSDAAVAATRAALAAGEAPQDIIDGQMIAAMSEIGQRFQDGKAFVPQLLMAARAMKAAMEELKPLMAGTSANTKGNVVIGTVRGDLHDIGKNLVAAMLEGGGFEVTNLGVDVAAETFVDVVREQRPDILCLSALLTTTMGQMKDVIDALQRAGLRQQVKVMVGGAPVTQAFADRIGADGYADNANTAVIVAKKLLGR